MISKKILVMKRYRDWEVDKFYLYHTRSTYIENKKEKLFFHTLIAKTPQNRKPSKNNSSFMYLLIKHNICDGLR